MRVLLLLCVLEALVLSGCRKKSSPEFFKLDSQQSVLVARDGDDAYASQEMGAIITGLQLISEDALEKPRATELATRLTAEQTRVMAERALAAAPKPPPPDPFAGRELSPPPSETPPAPAADPADQADAGPAPVVPPWAGMEEKLFLDRYGKCFSVGPKAALPDGRAATQYTLKDSADCQKQHGSKDTRLSYLFTEKGLWGKSSETTSVMDAGTLLIPPAPQPPPPPPGPPVITTPGAPLPEGYEKAP